MSTQTWLAICVGVAFATPAAAQSWRVPLERGQQEYAAGDFAAALGCFDAARSALGDPLDEDGAPRWSAADHAAYEATRCPRALSRMALGEESQSDEGASWALAQDQASFACGDAELAVAALLMGDTLHAALRLQQSGAQSFVAPFATRRLPAAAQAFGLEEGVLPVARDVSEAHRYVQALARLRDGLNTRCGEARGIAWTTPNHGETDFPMGYDESDPLPPFTGERRDPLATIRCVYPIHMAPEERGNPELEEGYQVFLVRRESNAEITVRGSFPEGMLEHQSEEMQNEVANFALSQGSLYAFVRASGSSLAPGEEEHVEIRANICDLQRRRCRSLPIQIRSNAYDPQMTLRRQDWRGNFSVRGGRIRLRNARGAPGALSRFRRGVTLEEFFSSPSIEFPSTPPSSSE